MEGHSVSSSSESKSEVRKKGPVIVAEFVNTPEFQLAMDHHSGVLKPSDERPLESPAGEIQNSNEKANPLLEEVEAEVLENMNNQLRLQAAVVAAAIVLGGYYAWKAGWFDWKSWTPN